jgi:hypothetical protein
MDQQYAWKLSASPPAGGMPGQVPDSGSGAGTGAGSGSGAGSDTQ